MFLDPLLILGSYSFVTKIIPFTHIMQWYDISSVKNSLRLETCRGLFKLIVLLELENSTKAKSKRIYCCSFWLYPKWHFLKTDLNENSQDTIVEKLKWIEEKISGQFFTAALLSLSSPTNTTLLQRHHLSPAQGRFKFREINCNKCFMNKDFFFLVYLSSYMLSSSPDPWSLGSASSHQPTTSAPLKIFTLCSLSTDFSGLHISPLKPKLYSHIKQNPNLSQVSHVITFSHCPCPFLLPFPLLPPPASPQIENILPLLLRATGVPNRLLFRYTAFDRLKFRFSLDLKVGKLISFLHRRDIWIFHCRS